MKEFDTWALAVGIGGEFWPVPGFRKSQRKNVTTWTVGWLYLSLMVQRLNRHP